MYMVIYKYTHAVTNTLDAYKVAKDIANAVKLNQRDRIFSTYDSYVEDPMSIEISNQFIYYFR